MRKHFIIAILYTVVTTVLLGIGYPLLITGLAQVLMKDKANGSLVIRNGKVVGSRLLAQPFTGPGYFHPRPSAAGANGYDPTASGGTNFGPTNQKLVDRLHADLGAFQTEGGSKPVPIDAITASASGLDPHITIANAEFQVERVAKARNVSVGEIDSIVKQFTQARQLGFLGEARINVLGLNLALDERYPLTAATSK